MKANMPGWLNSLALFAAYAVVATVSGSRGFSVSQAITSLSLLNLIDEPLTALSYAIPNGWAAISCFARIQEFLLETSRRDTRIVASYDQHASTTASQVTDSIEMSTLHRCGQATNSFAIEDGAFGWSESSDVVKGINLTVDTDAKLTLVVGPVGCGKVWSCLQLKTRLLTCLVHYASRSPRRNYDTPRRCICRVYADCILRPDPVDHERIYSGQHSRRGAIPGRMVSHSSSVMCLGRRLPAPCRRRCHCCGQQRNETQWRTKAKIGMATVHRTT